jgi:ribose transport system ATP-binding protein
VSPNAPALTMDRLSITGLAKRFGNTTVLDDVQLRVSPGEVHAIVGQNGSGKSTLVKLLAGVHRPEPGGEVLIDGAPLHLPARPKDLLGAGVSFVHQDIGVLDGVSVLENMCVGRFEARAVSRRIAWPAHEQHAREVLDRLGLNADPRQVVDGFSREQRTLVAIGRALMCQRPGSGVIVLDEATRALPPDSLDSIYAVLREIVQAGGSVVMITHNLAEVAAVADKVTVLRDGRVAAGGVVVAETNESEIAKSMLGYLFDAPQRTNTTAASGAARVRVEGLAGGRIREASLDVKAGETLGITGRPGSGADELPYLLCGVRPCTQGTLQIDSDVQSLDSCDVSHLLDLGVVLIPEGRATHGLAFEMSVGDNLTLPRLVRNGRSTFVGSRWRRQEVEESIRAFDIRPADPSHLVRMLSGGNQQKVLLAKWFAHRPRLLVLHEPTQAVDLGARAEIIAAIRAEAERGTSIIIVSAEAAELHVLCERVLVIEDGLVDRVLSPSSAEEIVEAVYAHSAVPEEQKVGVR